jgi:two-component system, sensor histidine kinase
VPKSKRKPSGRTASGAARKRPASRAAASARLRKTRASEADTAIEVALAGLAHDIRTPLTGILSLAELLQASDLPERERRWAATIKGTAEHLAQLTTVVVDAAKAGSSGLVLRREPFVLRDLAVAVAETLTARADGKGLGVDISIPKTLPGVVIGDAVRLRSALENLIDNAVKFTERGRIGLRVSAAPGARGGVVLAFTVKDSGIGITEADLKRLFRPFAQASAEVSRRYGGAGLGLAFVKRIAHAMGGGLDVESLPGRGSSFRLTVAVEPAQTTRAPNRTRKAGGASRPLRLLCVEDNPFGRVVLNAILTELGHRVEFAGTGAAAVSAIRRGGYDAAVMDVTLPDMDGLETTRRIRRLSAPAGSIPVIGLSGRSEPSDAENARIAGMDAYLAKPAGPAELHAALTRVTAARKLANR